MIMAQLIVLRHAKAERGYDLPTDEERALAERGRSQMVSVAAQFHAGGLMPDVALVSPAVRTRQTWEVLALRLPGAPKAQFEPSLYLASVVDVLDLVRGLSDAVGTAIVVGHEPTMAATAAYCAGPGSDATAVAQVRAGLLTAGWAVLESQAPWPDWGRATARLVAVGRG
jgi:phosphohistidine phosphatase